MTRASLAATVLAVLVLAGVLVWFVPYVTRKQPVLAGVAAPPALGVIQWWAIAPGDDACMGEVAIEADARLVEFEIDRATTPHGNPALELVLTAPGYRSTGRVPRGYIGGVVNVPVTPPRRAEIGNLCFRNRGRSRSIALAGATEPRAITRSSTTVNGKAVVGEIAVLFLANRSRSLLASLDEVFGHVSNLTEGLLPIWLLWILTVVIVAGVPIGVVAAFFLALREDEVSAS